MSYKPGGGGAVGWTELVNKKPDGYFISGMNIPHIVLQPLSDDNVGYKTEEITPIAAGDIIYQEVLETCNGKQTKSEILKKNIGFAIHRTGVSI